MPSECGVTSSRIIVAASRRSAPRPGSPRRARRPRRGARPCTARARRTRRPRSCTARHARHAADQDHVLDLVLVELGVLERLRGRSRRCARPGRSVSSSSLSRVSVRCRCSASLRPVEMMNGRLISVSRTLDSSHLAFSAASLQALQRHAVLAQIDAVLLLEAVDQPVDDARVEVLAAEERVAGGADHLEHAVRADLEDARCRTCRRRGRRPRPCARCCLPKP